jgi:hypothetical protein
VVFDHHLKSQSSDSGGVQRQVFQAQHALRFLRLICRTFLRAVVEEVVSISLFRHWADPKAVQSISAQTCIPVACKPSTRSIDIIGEYAYGQGGLKSLLNDAMSPT